MIKYIRILYTVYALFIFSCIMLVILIPILLVSMIVQHPEKIIHNILRLWAKTWYFFIGINHKAINSPTYKKDETYIFIANHVSYLDIPSIILSIDTPVKILGKAELGKIPIFGWIYKIVAVTVDRGDNKSKSTSLLHLKRTLEKGVSIILFPEGGIIASNEILNPFYSGAFKLSVELKLAIAPILLLNTDIRLKQYSIFTLSTGTSFVKYLPIISPADFIDLNKLREYTFRMMKTELEKEKVNKN